MGLEVRLSWANQRLPIGAVSWYQPSSQILIDWDFPIFISPSVPRSSINVLQKVSECTPCWCSWFLWSQYIHSWIEWRYPHVHINRLHGLMLTLVTLVAIQKCQSHVRYDCSHMTILYVVQNLLYDPAAVTRLIIRLCRLQDWSHTRLTHSYLLSGDDQPVCSACQSPLTVKHFLIEGRLPLTSWWRKSSNMTVGQCSLIYLAHHCYDWHPGSRCG